MARNGRKRYGLGRFALDFFLTIITGGVWLLFLFIRALRNAG